MSARRSAIPPLCVFALAACACTLSPDAIPVRIRTAEPQITLTPTADTTVRPALSPTTLPAPIATQAVTSAFCADDQPRTLVSNFKAAVTSSNGPLLASLVSPDHGLEARLIREGRVVTYDREQAKYLFESTFVVDWGPAPGSGLATKGSFDNLVVPALLDVFGRDYALSCDELQVGGTTYQAVWPYAGISFYSLYFTGTQAYGYLDWRTWAVGMHYVDGKPYLYAIVQYQWEP